MEWNVNLITGPTSSGPIYFQMMLQGVIGVSFLLIAACILYGTFTSPEKFFVYVGGVFGAFIGLCGIARTSRLVCYCLTVHHLMLPLTALMVVDIADLMDAAVAVPAAIAVIWITIYFIRHPGPLTTV